MKTVYISGKISGLSREDYMARFALAERLIREKGYRVVNPTRLAPCRWPWLYRLLGYRLTLMWDIWHLTNCDLIYKLPGWQQSRGANIESCVAYHFKVWPMSKPDVDELHKALNKLIKTQERNHERHARSCSDCRHYDDNNSYGKPYCNHSGNALDYDQSTCNHFKRQRDE